jgi:hypothetical protein
MKEVCACGPHKGTKLILFSPPGCQQDPVYRNGGGSNWSDRYVLCEMVGSGASLEDMSAHVLCPLVIFPGTG